MKYLILVFCVAWNAASFGQDKERSIETNEEIEYLQNLLLEQAITLDEINKSHAEEINLLGRNQERYANSLVKSTLVGSLSLGLTLLGVSSTNEAVYWTGIAGSFFALAIRIDGMVKYFKGSRRFTHSEEIQAYSNTPQQEQSGEISSHSDQNQFKRLEEGMTVKFLLKGEEMEGVILSVWSSHFDYNTVYTISYQNKRGKHRKKPVLRSEILD